MIQEVSSFDKGTIYFRTKNRWVIREKKNMHILIFLSWKI